METRKDHMMGKKIVTEADRKATPAPKTTEGLAVKGLGGGQMRSRKRGSHTNNKKNPGKRAHSG
ncbi:MAG TPA: hypothetical protein VL593_01000 [Ramlibacter sp.]|nr:hypothetical protein [Ramlibacter sp.]